MVERDPLDGFAVSLKEATEELEKSRERRRSAVDRRVCICGHSAKRHITALGLTRCEPARMQCPCRLFTGVVEVSHINGFVTKTTGPGAQHALIRGLTASREYAQRVGSEFTVEWLVEPQCVKCGAEGVVPVALNEDERISHEPERVNTLLCEGCVRELS